MGPFEAAMWSKLPSESKIYTHILGIVCTNLIFNSHQGCNHLFQSKRQPPHGGGWIDVDIEATKHRYCEVKKDSVLDFRQALPNQFGEAFSYKE